MMRHPNIFILHEESESEDDEIDDHNDEENDHEQEAELSKKGFPEYRDGCAHVLGQQRKSHRLLEFIRRHISTDGMALGSVFILYGSVSGPSKTNFLLAYECPQEIGYYGILVSMNCFGSFSQIASMELIHLHHVPIDSRLANVLLQIKSELNVHMSDNSL
ncbi:unnamed protein product [Lactuca virosa]|uniref:Uncharacterized protein n=1 Tax=Lactuca virosa TaxID=75947 RepID=A0AAU9LF88_9ASTR|nr:unnamed protein product [Lactuca virosa]